MSTHQLQLDPTVCVGRGHCADFLPELLGIDEWGYPLVAGGGLVAEVSESLVPAAREAVTACPVGALRLVRGSR